MREKRYHPPGVPPGTLTPLAGAIVPQSFHVIHYTADAVDEADLHAASEVAAYKDRPGVTWVNVDGLGDVALIRELGHLFGLHPLALEDVLNVPQRPKVDYFEDHLFLVTRMLEYDDALRTEQVSLFLGHNFVLTFQEDATDDFAPIRERIRKGSGQFRKLGPDYLMYTLLDATVDRYFPFLESFGETVEELEDLVVEQPTQKTLASVHEVRRDLLNIRRCVWPLRDVLGDLLRDETPLITKGTRVYLRDVHQHLVYLLDLVETYRELTASLMDVYISSVSNRLNEVMKVLTIIATIFMPLTFIAGVYGMNFRTDVSPFNMPELTWRWGYVAFWVVILLTAIVMLILFRRKGWLGGKPSAGQPPSLPPPSGRG